jgi:hypothetical protein
MTCRSLLAVVGILFVATFLSAQQSNSPLIYVKHLEPPHYPALGRQAQIQGTVIVRLTIGADGAVLTTESIARAHPLLREETEKLVKRWTFGCVNCSPNVPFEKTIKFIYRLEGEGVPYDNSRVVMELPDEITITASPRECDHCPPKKVTK